MSKATNCTSPGGHFIGHLSEGSATYDHIVYASADQPFDWPTLRTYPSQIVGRPDQTPLVLRITAPADAKLGEDLPVLAFIHGGGFDSGGRNDHWFNGSNLAAQRVIMVSIDYRLGLKGFARFPDDQPDTYRGISDCQVALDWLQYNIEDFGGDPTNVTLAGQSAGATIALWLSRRDHYRGTFRRVFALSPGFPRESFEQRKSRLRFALGMPVNKQTLGRRLAQNPQRVERGYKQFKLLTPTDVPLGPTALEGSELADIPIVLTCTEDEFFATRRGKKVDKVLPRALRAATARHFLANANYLDHTQDEPRFFSRIVGDSAIRRHIDDIAASAPGPTWVMHYTGTPETPAVHCCDIPWVLDSEDHVKEGTAEHIPDAASDTVGFVRSTVDNFIRGTMPQWPTYQPDRDTLELSVTDGTAAIKRDPFAALRASFTDAQ